MTTNFDVFELIKDMNSEEAMEYLSTHLNKKTRDEFLQRRRGEQRATVNREAYDKRVDGILKRRDLTTRAKNRLITNAQIEYGIIE